MKKSQFKNWYEREDRLVPPQPVRENYLQLPVSENVEDRRNDPISLADVVASFTGYTPSELGTMLRNPLTPTTQSLSDRHWRYPPAAARTDDPLSAALGYNDIPASASPQAVPETLTKMPLYNQGMPWQGKPGGAAKLGEYVDSARPYVAKLMARGGSFLTPFTAMSPMKMLEATTPSIQRAASGPEPTPNDRVAGAFDAVGPGPMWNSLPTTLSNPTAGKFAPMLPAEPQAPAAAAPAAAVGPDYGSRQYPVEDQSLIQKFLGMIYDKGSRGFESAPEGPRVGPFAR